MVATIDPQITDLRGQGPITVSFRGYDVDDPSATTEPVDLDGDAILDFVADNRMTPQSGLLRDNSGAEVSGTLMVDLPASGVTAATVFRVSPRQGDNYKVVASTTRQWLGEIRAFQPSGTGEIRHETGRQLTQEEGDQASPLLTVWRTLHIEQDHLDSGSTTEPDFHFRGQISKLKPQQLTDKDASFVLGPEHPYKDDWEGADLWPRDPASPTAPPAGDPVKVLGNGKEDLDVPDTVDLTTMAAVSDTYRLKDDYRTDLTGGAPLSIAQRLLKEVYIELKPLQEGNNTVAHAFSKNLPSFELIRLPRDVASAEAFWAVQVVNAFDGPIGDRKANPPDSGDNDPDVESGVLGQTGGSGPDLQQMNLLQPVCGIFNESMRDSRLERGWTSDVVGRTTAHEIICHGLKVGHSPEGDLCFESFEDGPMGDQLRDPQRAELRRLPQPTVR